MRPYVRRLTLSVSLLLAGISAVASAEPPTKNADPGGISLQTLDGDVQQVEINEIWRIRAATGREEPTGAVLIDYAFERLFVKDSLDNVLSKVRDQRRVERFTLPSGTPIYIVAEKIIGITRAMPGQHHERSKSLIIAREGQQQVQESRDVIRDILKK